MSSQYSMSEEVSRVIRKLRLAAAVPMAGRSQIHQRGDQEPEQVDSLDSHMAIDHPGIEQRGERQEDEAQYEEQDAVEGPVKVLGEKEEERYRHAGKREHHDQE